MQTSLLLVLSLTGAALGFKRGLNATTTPCYNDNCARAVTGTHRGPSHPSSAAVDCSNYLITTITPATVTVTATAVPTNGSDFSILPIALPTIPAYATPCSNAAAYSSACSCFGILPGITTAPTPTFTSYASATTSFGFNTTSSIGFNSTTTSTSTAPACTQTLTDPNNCGACGNVCSAGVCENGSCVDRTCEAQTCGGFVSCEGNVNCFCFTSADPAPNNGFCGQNAVCSDLTACATDVDCEADGSSGNICAVDTCCPEPSSIQPGVCLQGSCENPARKLMMMARAVHKRSGTAAFL